MSGVYRDLYTHPKPRICVTSPLELVTQSLQFENMTSPSSQQDPSASPAPFARAFKEMQGVHVLVGNSALHGFPLQQRENWALCSIGTAMTQQSPPKPRCQDSWLLREADKSEVYNEIWWGVHVLLRRGMNSGLLKVVLEIHMWNRCHGNLGCFLAILFHQEGGCFSDDCMCFAGTISWKSEVVLLHRNPWTSLSHSMQYFIFPGTSFWVCLHCSYQSAAWLWSHLSLPHSGRCVESKICFTKAKSLLAMVRSLQNENILDIFTGPSSCIAAQSPWQRASGGPCYWDWTTSFSSMEFCCFILSP